MYSHPLCAQCRLDLDNLSTGVDASRCSLFCLLSSAPISVYMRLCSSLVALFYDTIGKVTVFM